MYHYWYPKQEMKCCSENLDALRLMRCASWNMKAGGFTLVEAVTAVIILGLIASSMLVVINRCTASAADSALRMQAFDVARENMEKLLASNSVEESVEYGTSDTYPEIKWETVVETFYEPLTTRMWVRAICSAEYDDSAGETQKVELTHWLTDVTKEQLLEIAEREQEQEQQLAEQLIETVEEAAEYAGVDIDTIQQWLENGMLTTEDGAFLKANLDLYKRTNGSPADEEQAQQVQSIEQLLQLQQEQSGPGEEQTPEKQDWQNEIDPTTGLTHGELEQMDVYEVLEVLKKRYQKDL